MPPVRKSGTAWERRLDEYAYTKGLDGPGWAWEFLRRNDKFLIECRSSRAGLPVQIKHISGAIYLRPRRKFSRAESWELTLFPDPKKSANETPVFWHPGTLTHYVNATLSQAKDNADETLSLNDFVCQRVVLVDDHTEHVIVRSAHKSIRLHLLGQSILFGKCKCIFHVEGFSNVNRFTETLRTLSKLRDQNNPTISQQSQFELHLRDYLVALDGHLAGRSYRDIAEVIYGSDRVKNVWTNETRFLKETVRRAVRRGLDYMNGEYRSLL